MVMDSIRRLIRTTGPNPALTPRPRSVSWSRSYSGVSVTEETAIGLSAVYRSIVLIATTAGGLPLHVYRELPDGSRQRIRPEGMRVLWDKPNPDMTRQTFWEVVFGHEVMGDAFIFVVKDRNGDPLELWPIEPSRVKIGRTPEGRKVYQVDDLDPMIDYSSGGEIIHIPNFGRDGLRGLSPIKASPAVVSLGLSSQEYADRFFGADSTPNGLLSSDQDLTMEQAQEIADLWEATHQGLERQHRIAVLGRGANFHPVSISPHDAQLLEERRFQLSEIARLFGVPPHMLGDVDRSTSWGSGIEEQTHGFLTFTLQAHINRFEHAVNDSLLRKGSTGRFLKFDLGGLLRGTTLQRYQAYAVGYGRWLSVNEIRRDEDLSPIEGGDDVLAPQNLIPLEDLAAVQGEAEGGAGNEPSGAPPDLPAGSSSNGTGP